MPDDPIFLHGQRAIVTGAGRGIGRAVALTLARRGADVAVWEIDAETAVDTARAVAALGVRGEAFTVDVTRKSAVDEAMQAVIASFGGVEILVNNAGWDRFMPFVETTEAFWDRVIAINYRGVLNCTHAVAGHMVAARRGAIVNVASDAGRVGSSGEAVYSGAKGAVIAFSRTMARELARHAVRVNVVCPGPTETTFFAPGEGMSEDQMRSLVESIVRAIPFRRMAQPEEVAEAVAFLASPAAAYITGQALSVNGGLNML
jgi:2-hydroxycyclohexanecarboxyl-CoA dehydrogenase